MSNAPAAAARARSGVLADIEKRMTSRKGKLEAAASLVPCTGSGSLKSYINYVTAESDNFVPDSILDPEKGVEFGVFAEFDDDRELTREEIEYNEQQAALAALKKKYGEKEFDKDARRIERQLEAIARQFAEHQVEIDRSKERERPIRLMKERKEVQAAAVAAAAADDSNASEVSSGRSRKKKGEERSRTESGRPMDAPSDKRQRAKHKKLSAAGGDLFDDFLDRRPAARHRGKKTENLLEDSFSDPATEDDESLYSAAEPDGKRVHEDKSASSYAASMLAQSFAMPQDGSANLSLFLDPMADLANKHPTLAKLVQKEEKKRAEKGRQEQQERAERGIKYTYVLQNK